MVKCVIKQGGGPLFPGPLYMLSPLKGLRISPAW